MEIPVEDLKSLVTALWVLATQTLLGPSGMLWTSFVGDRISY